MPIAFPSRPYVPTTWTQSAKPKPTNLNPDWRCKRCGKLLGIRRGTKLHVRLQGHEYQASLPVEAFCRGCGTHNRT